MNVIDHSAGPNGYETTTYADAPDFRPGRNVVVVTRETGGRFTAVAGWQERNGWNGSIEFCCAPSSPARTYKTERGALRFAKRYIESRA